MKNMNLFGQAFQHANCSTWDKIPKTLKWDYNVLNNDITVYVEEAIDGYLDKHDDSKIKFAWLLESKAISPTQRNVLNNPKKYLDKFDAIFTCDENLIKVDKKFLWCPAYGVSIEKWGGNKKTKLVSMITSNKTMTEQQRFRLQFAKNNRNNLDLFGRGFRPVSTKDIGLDDYMFSVAIENATYDTYFTEKILDCFASKTIPIYKGTRKITEYFDPNGIIFLDDINNDITKLTEKDYYDRIDSVENNFNKVKELDILDDWIFKKHIKKWLK